MTGVPRTLLGKIAIITGASSGLGRAVALAFTKHGATVVCADKDASSKGSQQPTHELLRDKGGESIFVGVDVTKADSVKQMVRATVDQFGRVDIMVNNAGIAPEASNPGPVWEKSEEIFDMTWQVNVRGVFLGCKYAGAQMLKQSDGRHGVGSIINISSVLGLKGLAGTSAYAASKGAVIALTRTIAMDYAPHQIRCNSILPGFTRTPMISSMTDDPEFTRVLSEVHPLQRIGEPEEIADAAVFLASESASGITGANLSVDGGLHAQLRLK